MKFAKFSAMIGAVTMVAAGMIAGVTPKAEAAGVPCPGGQLRYVAGVDYSGLNVNVKCVATSGMGGSAWATANPIKREIVVYHGPTVAASSYASLLSHEAMHIVHFYTTGANEMRLSRSMNYVAPVDWRSQIYTGTPGTNGWRSNLAEGIAEGWPKCLGMRTMTMKYTPVDCSNFAASVLSTAYQSKNGRVVNYATPTAKKGQYAAVSGIYLNQRPGKWMYEFRMQGNGQDLILGRTTRTFTTTSAKGGQFGINYKTPAAAVAGRTYKIVSYRYAVNPDGSRGYFAASHPASGVSTVKVTY